MTRNPAAASSPPALRGRLPALAVMFFFFSGALVGCTDPALLDIPDDGPSPARSPAGEQATFRLQPGLRIELVASEPLVQDPVAMTFDADGRLWVVEMRGFMPDIDGTGSDEPSGRISVLTDTDGDGMMDARTVFLDSLVLPRAVAVVPGGALVAENKPLWFAADADGDLVAESKTLIDSTYGGSGLPEHSANGLWRGLDNWYYNAKSSARYRFTGGRWVRDSTEFRGQWGLSHDDEGRLFYNYNWSQLHADLVPPNSLTRNPHHTPTSGLNVGVSTDRRIFPIRPNPAANRGYIEGALDEQGRLLEFTSAGAPLVYRGTALPASFHGSAFVCEPVGNLIKQNLIDEGELAPTARLAYPASEFLASTDERFRPVFLATGPDGALYVADMYRGIIQDGVYMTPYLREQTLARGLDRPVHLGRIWRIVAEDWTPPPPVRLSTATVDELVALLSHPDGWYRDTAQRLLVERQDPAAAPLLADLALQGAERLGRLHALWTLEGLGHKDPAVFFRALHDPHPRIRAAAFQLLEALAREDALVRARLEAELASRRDTASPVEALQMALTAGAIGDYAALTLLPGLVERYGDRPLIRDAALSSLHNREYALLQRLWTAPRWQDPAPELAIFIEMLATAVARKGDPAELSGLLALLDVADDSFAVRETAVLTGLAVPAGDRSAPPVRLAAAPAALTRIDAYDAGAQPHLRTLAARFAWPGHAPRSAASTHGATNQTPLDAADWKRFSEGRQHYLTVCAGCHGSDGAGLLPLGPPLVDSEWVLGDAGRLVRILLHGLEGPIEVNGHRYEAPEILTEMPSLAVLDDAALAAVATYVRNAWGHAAGPVDRRMVGRIRVVTQGRVAPWNDPELRDLPPDPDPETGGDP